MSFHRDDMHEAAYLKLNPEGKVPTLVVDGRPLTEVAAILFYLARCFPEAGLLPQDVEAEAHALSWMSFIAATLHPARGHGPDHARQTYAIADRRLGANWALGERYSIADIHLFRLYWRLFNALQPAPGTFPNLDAHYQRMMARPAVAKTIEIEAAIGYELPA
jgi:glutathione S-transferase